MVVPRGALSLTRPFKESCKVKVQPNLRAIGSTESLLRRLVRDRSKTMETLLQRIVCRYSSVKVIGVFDFLIFCACQKYYSLTHKFHILSNAGDCDRDSDCAPGLKCDHLRGKLEAVPGCLGGLEFDWYTDFCIFDETGPGYHSPRPIKNHGDTPNSDKLPLQLCEGETLDCFCSSRVCIYVFQ